ncbi:MAG TPA: DUF6531 domain-containing protein, partial [Stellaceae bacterium]
MRRLTLLAMAVAAVCLALSWFGAREARAGWSSAPGIGAVGEPQGGWPTKRDACISWQVEGYITDYQYWVFAPPGAGCYGINPNVSGPISPICTGSNVYDAGQDSGCHPANAAPLPKELGQNCPTCGNPISLAGGNKFQTVTDFETATPDKLGFTRYYNSGGALGQLTTLGYGWQSMYDVYIDTTNWSGWVY